MMWSVQSKTESTMIEVTIVITVTIEDSKISVHVIYVYCKNQNYAHVRTIFTHTYVRYIVLREQLSG